LAGAARRHQVDADLRFGTPPDCLAVERGGEGPERVGLQAERPQRLDARPGEDELGAGDRGGGPLAGAGLDLGHLDPAVAPEGLLQHRPRAPRHRDRVGEEPIGVVAESHPDGRGRALEPAADDRLGAEELGGEAKDRLRVGRELVGRDQRELGPRGERAPGRDEPLPHQR
jgi:hypothetical protein